MECIYVNRNNVAVDLIFNISQIFLYLFTIDVIFSSFIFIFNMGIRAWTLPLSTVFAIFIFWLLNKNISKRIFISSCIVALIIFCILTAMCGYIVDFSWDGNAYHKVAVGLLEEGWNPLYQNPEETGRRLLQGHAPFLFVECYPKATWFFAASIYAITGNIECGKVYTLLCIFSAFGFTLFFLRSFGYGKIFTVLFSLAAALNPIALAQFDTFYLDGCLHLLVYILILALIVNLCATFQRLKKVSNTIIASCMILCFNTKFTGAFFVCIYCSIFFISYCIYIYITNKQEFLKYALKKFTFFGVVAILAALLVGSSTYVTNYIHHRNIGYPVIGKNKINIITSSAFESENRVSNLFYSLFSYQENIQWRHVHRKPLLKIPFTYSIQREHNTANTAKTDMRIAGFGPLFSGVLILSLIFILVRCIGHPKEYTSIIIMCIIFSTILLCAIIYESWWARYAPYLYCLVLCGAYAAYLYRSPIMKCISLLMCAVLILNDCYFLLRVPSLLKAGDSIAHEIAEMKKHDTVLYKYGPYAHGTYFNLVDSGIHLIRDEHLEKICEDMPLRGWGSSWCPKNGNSK